MCRVAGRDEEKEGVKETEFKVTYDGFKKFIKGTKESKSSLPSGRHYGHYKALRDEEELCKLMFEIVQVAVENGIVLER